jgi:hypothetical protein
MAIWPPICEISKSTMPRATKAPGRGAARQSRNAMKPEGGCYCGKLRYATEGESTLRAQNDKADIVRNGVKASSL